MRLPDQFFIRASEVPANAVEGQYDLWMVVLSYVVAATASYTALGIAADLRGREESSERIRLLAGTFAIGGGIWSMHFIGMIAYDTDMALEYDPVLTGLSMLLAMLFAWAAFMIVRKPDLGFGHVAIAAPFLGSGVAAMHYTGMAAMEMDATLQYTPWLFAASIGIGIAASAAALEMLHFARQKTHGSRRTYLALAALIMAGAVCGLHYTGMAATVIIPFADCRWDPDASYTDFGMIIALIMGLILFIAYLTSRLERAMDEAASRTKNLVSLQHNELVAQIVGGFAHEFNNALGVIMAQAEDALAGAHGDKSLEDRLNKVVSRSKDAAELTESLLGFTQQKNLVPTVCDINDGLCKMEGILQHALGPGIVLTLKTTPDICTAQIDPGEFKNAIMNLVINARDALGESGNVTVQTERLYMAGDMLSTRLPSGTYVAVSVVDDGPGIPVEIRDHIIEPFYTTKDVGEGSGLGLSVVHGFATQSGGALDFYSEIGKGSTFTIYLPAAESRSDVQDKAASGWAAGPAFGDETLLVVEDDDDIRRYITRIARELGYTVFKAASAQAAKGLIDKGLEADVVLCDAHLHNGENGIELAALIERELPQTHIVIMSGMSGLTNDDKKQIRNDYLFIQKPFSRERLGATLRTAIDSEAR